MKNAAKKHSIAQSNILGLMPANYPASSLESLIAKLEASSEESYKALFEEMKNQGNVPHDSSIIGPAAYFADLMRMVISHENQNQSLPNSRKLKQRRPDLFKIPMDAAHTTAEKPYLELVNEALSSHSSLPNQPRAYHEERMSQLSYFSLGFDLPMQRVLASFEAIGTPVHEVLETFGHSSEADAASLGMDAPTLKLLGDLWAFQDANKQFMMQGIMLNAMENVEGSVSQIGTKGMEPFIKRIGIDADLLAAAKIGENNNSIISNLISHAVHSQEDKDAAARASYVYAYKTTDVGLQLCYWPDVGSRNDEPTLVSLYQSHATFRQYTSALVELRRLSLIAAALGWSGKELIYVAQILEGSPQRINYFLQADILHLAQIRSLQTKHNVSLEDAVLLMGFTYSSDVETPDGDPSYGFDVVPAEERNLKFRQVTMSSLPSWLAASEGITTTQLQRIFAVAERARINSITNPKAKETAKENFAEARVSINQKTMLLPHQYVVLANVLDSEIDDILLLQEGLSLPFETAEHVTALIELFEFLKSAKLEVKQMLAMAQVNTVATCNPADLRMAGQVILNGVGLPPLPEDPHQLDTYWYNAFASANEVLGGFYGMAPDLMREVMDASMSYEDRAAFYRAALNGAYSSIDPSMMVETSQETIAFSNFQAALLTVNSLKLTVEDLYNRQDSYGLGIKGGDLHDWRNLENLKQWHKAKTFENAAGTSIKNIMQAQDAVIFSESGVAVTSEQINEIIKLIAQVTGVETSYIDGLWTDRSNLPFVNYEDGSCVLDKVEALRQQGELGKSTKLDMPSLRSVVSLFNTDMSESNNPNFRSDWQNRRSISENICGGLTGTLNGEERSAMIEKANQHCLEGERDRMCADAINAHASRPPAEQMGYAIETKADLSKMLLIDVEMGGVSKISPIKLGLNALQNYIHRVQTNQETGPVPFVLDEKQWTWRAHYRLWEANRKVFLYPENFLDPGLRRHKTPLFKELEQELLQSEITEDNVTQALLGYLDKLKDLSELELVSACAAQQQLSNSDSSLKTIYILGRQTGETNKFYLRTCTFDSEGIEAVGWTAWEEIRLPIHATDVNITTVNSRPHLFWVESKFTGGRNGEFETRSFFGTIKFSYQLLAGGWSVPREVPEWTGFEQGTIQQNQVGGWAKTKEVEKVLVSFPTERPQVFFHLSQQAVDTNPNEKHPRIVSKFVERCDLINNQTLGQSLEDLPQPTDWAQAYYGASEWVMGDQIEAFLPLPPGKKVGGYIACHALVRTVDESAVIGLFSYADGQTARILRSDNFGLTWSSSDAGIKEHRTFEANYNNDYLHDIRVARHSGDMYVIGGARPIVFYHSGDRGQTWAPITPPKGVTSYNDLAVSGDGQTLILIADQKENVFYNNMNVERFTFISRDGGKSWNPLNALHATKPNQRFEAWRILIDLDSGHFIATEKNTNEVFISKNQGKSFDKSSFELSHGGRKAHIISDDFGSIYIAEGKQVYISDDGGKYFNNSMPATNQSISRLYHVNNNIVVGTPTDMQTWDGHSEKLDKFANFPTALTNPKMWKNTSNILFDQSLGQYLIGHNENGIAYSVPRRTHVIDKSAHGQELIKVDNTHFAGAHDVKAGTLLPKFLAEKLATHGLQAMLSLETQEGYLGNSDAQLNAGPVDFDLASGYGIYYRELFFHISYLIADILNRNKKFAEAQRWYHHIFKPNLIGSADLSGETTPFWRYKKFRDYELSHLTTPSPQEFWLYSKDPFDAHAIAALRLGAYEKAVVMRYIDNLLDWADSLFAQDNWESTTEAMSYYLQAYDLLGPDPAKDRKAKAAQNNKNYEEFEAVVSDAVNPLDTFHFNDKKVFPIPPNTYFENYWERTQLRMAEIRASEDIRGMKRQMQLFQPAIDPRKIMAALAAGMSMDQAVASLNQSRPTFRFSTLLHSARDMAGTVSSFGASLLSALEKKDAAGLEQLRNSQGYHIQEMTTQIKEAAVADASSRLEEVKARQSAAQAKKTHFKALIKKDLLEPEEKSLSLQNDALTLQATTAGIRTASAVAYLAPSIYGMSNGGMDYGRAVEVTAASLDSAAQAVTTSSMLSGARGQNDRRREDWHWQLDQIKADIARMKLDETLAKSAVENAKKELASHNKQIEQNETIQQYASDRFTNEQLYGWMVGCLTGLYKSAFNLALSVAQEAEAAYQFERHPEHGGTPIINQNRISNLQGALLSGEELQLSLNRLEKTHRDAAKMEQEVTRVLSLKTLSGDAKICADWNVIKETGVLPFSVSLEFLMQDQLGDCYRTLKSVAISVPAIVKPYQNINGILTQTEYTGPYQDSLPFNEADREFIAISNGVNDHGITNLDFNAPQYQPFEGSGAESSWQVRLPKDGADSILESISDVVIEICYVARTAGP